MRRRYFALSAVLLVASLVWAFVAEEQKQEWRRYQKEYLKLAVERAPTEALRAAATTTEIQLVQHYLPALHRVDRCESCHLGMQVSFMKGAKQPFSPHPEPHLDQHPAEHFGCTVCHQGQGRATNAQEAHGHVPFWERPKLSKELLQGSCGRCHRGERVPGAYTLTLGRSLMADLGCRACHLLEGQGGVVGPALDGVAEKDVNGDRHLNALDWVWHERHFAEPSKVSAGSIMPRFVLDKKEITALTTAMLALTSEPIPASYVVPEPVEPIRSVPDAKARGRKIWRTVGCPGCHGRDGKGGIENPNAQGKQVPPLARYAETVVDSLEDAERLTQLIDAAYRKNDLLAAEEAWLGPFRKMRETIQSGATSPKEDPKGDEPPLAMPVWREQLTEQEINDVIAHVIGLFPASDWGDDWDEED